MLKIDISEVKPNRFEQAANILDVAGTLRGLGLCVLSNLDGEVEVNEELYAAMEADIAAVGDWVSKDWLRAYGVGEEAAKLRLQDLLNTEITGKIPTMKNIKYSAEHPDGIELKAKTVVSEVTDKIAPALGSKWRSKGNGSEFTVYKSCAPELSGGEVYATHDATGLAYGFALDHWLAQFEMICAPKGNFFCSSGNTNYPKANTPDDKISGKHKEMLDELLGLNCNKVWAHKKSGNRYDVVAVTNTEATTEGFPLTVVYTRDGALWSRPISEFFEKFRVVKAAPPSEEIRRWADVFRMGLDPVELSPISKMEIYASKEGAWRRLQEQTPKMPDTFPDPQIQGFVNVSLKEFLAGGTTVKENAPVSAHPIQEVFDAAIAQVTTGKGQRHGGGEQPFFEQPWFTTTQQVGIGFPLGQAMKKLGESSSKPDAESFETELLGAIAYAAMAYLANKKLAGKI